MQKLLLLAALLGPLPETIWESDSGTPAISAHRDLGVSVVLPESAIVASGGGSVAAIAKDFLERWAPGMCSDVFDFQAPHPGLKIRVAIQTQPYPDLQYFVVGGYGAITIDYTPGRKVVCVTPSGLVS